MGRVVPTATAEEKFFFFQAEDGIRDKGMWLEFRRVLFRSQPKSVKMYRSWGKGWREIKLNQTCQYSWCGGGKYNAKYAFAFREGRNYSIKYEVIKNNPEDDIKWGYG